MLTIRTMSGPAVCAGVFLAVHAAAQGTVVDLGTLGGPLGSAADVSADGAVVVGYTTRADESRAAFYWTEAGGFIDLVPPGSGVSRPAEAHLVSADGRFAVGTWWFGSNRIAFRWSQATGLERLGSLSAATVSLFPRAVSDDGEVIVGEAPTATGELHAFRWSPATGVVDLGTLGGTFSTATGLSADGNVVIGRSYSATGAQRAFVWTAGTGMVDLGTLGGMSASAAAISADGSVIVGTAHDSSNRNRAFRWTSALGMQDLGTLGGAASFAVGVSEDGSIVVGNSTFGPSSALHAFRWSAATGTVDLGTLGGLQSFANGISGDGSVIFGGSQFDLDFRWSATTGMVELGSLGGQNTTVNAVSRDGRVLIGASTTYTATRAFRHVEGVRAAIGERYCAAAPPNSTGAQGSIEVLGSNALSAGDVSLTASNLPQQSFGFFLTSRTQDLVPQVGGGVGTLCLGGAIGRFVGAGQVQSTGAAGTFSLAVDVLALPQPTGPAAALAGEVWNFQAWHRDTTSTGATSNLTDAVAVTFR